jgi:hypothetical protein
MDIYSGIIVENILYYVSNLHSSQIKQLFLAQNTFFREMFTTYCCEISKLTDINTYTNAGARARTHTHTHTHRYMQVCTYVCTYACTYNLFLCQYVFLVYLVNLFHIPMIYTDVDVVMYTFSITNKVYIQHTF